AWRRIIDGGELIMSDDATLAANRLIGQRVLLELWGKGKLQVADELYAPTYIDHVAKGPEFGEVRGPEGIKQAVTLFRTAFSGLDVRRSRRDGRARPRLDSILRARHAIGSAPRGGADRACRHLYRHGP